MKKLLLSLVLAVSCNLSFGQSVTDFTFTGMLAKTVYSQFSIGSNNTLAAPSTGSITAIAGPNVDVANITDMTLTIGSGSSLITSPSPAGPVPTNYTGSILPITGLVYTNYPLVYLKANTVEKYRAVNIFIHKLVPASLPFGVVNTQQTTGFAHCGEAANSGGGTLQLHTNGQAAYLAFNSAADVVSFQYENVGTVTADPDAAIIVEKSADLVNWTSIQSIDISSQVLSTKVTVSYSVNDAAARYIRIRIDGLANSRNIRKENIRNIFVTNSSTNTWIGGTSTAWTDTANWSKGSVPTSDDDVLIVSGTNQPSISSGGPYTIKSLSIGSGSFTVGTGRTLNVTNPIVINGGTMTVGGTVNAPATTVNSSANLAVNTVIDGSLGTLTINNGGNLTQSVETANTGTITVNRNSTPLKRLDYAIWSSPVSGSQTLEGFSPKTSRNPNQFWTYDAATNKFANVATTSTFAAGLGYLIRMPNDAITSPIAFAGQFTGIPNNGTITLSGLTAGKFYSIGNPYPSTISATNFLNGNSTAGTLYFWRKTNGASGSAYATRNLSGGTASGAGSAVPSATIPVGQGFIVNTTGTTLTFTNTMRTTASPTTLNFKTKKETETEKSCVWLNLTNTEGLFSQALVGYLDGATVGVDNGYDGLYINDSATALTSIVDGEEYTIQGRPAFDAKDVVALGFKTAAAGNFTIAVDSKDGVFAAEQDIYLVDSKTGIETDLKANSYTFAAEAGVDNARFTLKYQKTLKVGEPTFDENTVKVYKNNGTIYVNAAEKSIKTIEVFDVQGRLLAKQTNVKSNTATISNLKAVRQMLIVKVSADDNTVVSKKIVN